MSDLLTRSVVIVLVGIALGFAGNQLSPRRIPLITPPRKASAEGEFLPLQKARELWSGGNALFLDAREAADYRVGHIASAVNLPVMSFDLHFPEFAPMLTPESLIVVYCDGRECELSHRLSDALRQQGFTNVHMLFNGWTAWKEAGYPTETGGAQ